MVSYMDHKYLPASLVMNSDSDILKIIMILIVYMHVYYLLSDTI